MNQNRRSIRKYIILLTGLVILAVGISLFIISRLGADPYTSLNMGLSFLTHQNFAIVQIVLNFIILAIISCVDRTFVGIGTVLALVGVGPMIQLFSNVFSNLAQIPLFTANPWLLMLLGCLIVSIGAGLYISADCGLGPYDILPILLETKKICSFKWARVGLDTLCVIIGFILGAQIGLGTLIAAFLLGPAIEFFRNISCHYLIE